MLIDIYTARREHQITNPFRYIYFWPYARSRERPMAPKLRAALLKFIGFIIGLYIYVLKNNNLFAMPYYIAMLTGGWKWFGWVGGGKPFVPSWMRVLCMVRGLPRAVAEWCECARALINSIDVSSRFGARVHTHHMNRYMGVHVCVCVWCVW